MEEHNEDQMTCWCFIILINKDHTESIFLWALYLISPPNCTWKVYLLGYGSEGQVHIKAGSGTCLHKRHPKLL